MKPTTVLQSVLLAAALVVASATPAASTEALSQQAFEQRLTELQEHVRSAMEHLETGEREAALEDARQVADAFSFNGSGASPLELAIKNASAVAIGDRVKALASQFVSAIEAGEPLPEIREIARELEPSLNRLVLVAQGKAIPSGERKLTSEEAIDQAHQDVLDLIDQALEHARGGEQTAGVQMAKEAFFAFETNGLGPDSSIVDEPLENRAENLIVNFNRSSAETDPGLAGLIEQNAPMERIEAKADEVRSALGQVAELLKATLPDVTPGDANGDGSVTIVDALLTAQASLGIREHNDAMDANQDGSVSIVDALLIAQASLGIRSL